MGRIDHPFYNALRKILEEEKFGTQEEICEELARQGQSVTQSTVSRALRKLGAIRGSDAMGRSVYRLPYEDAPAQLASLGDLIREIAHNGVMIVIHTSPGSASLVARHLDHFRPGDILGTVAGDDTIFVAPARVQGIEIAIQEIQRSLSEQEK